MQRGPLPLEQALVHRVADEDVVEGAEVDAVLLGGPLQELRALERVGPYTRPRRAPCLPRARRRRRAGRCGRSPRPGRGRADPRGEPVDPGAQQRVDRGRQPARGQRGEHPGVALLDRAAPRRRASRAAAARRAGCRTTPRRFARARLRRAVRRARILDHRRGLGLVEPSESDRGRSARLGRFSSSSVRAAQTVSTPAPEIARRERVEQVVQGRLGPVEILDRAARTGRRARDVLEQAPEAPEELGERERRHR